VFKGGVEVEITEKGVFLVGIS